jgi:hypothetical protein
VNKGERKGRGPEETLALSRAASQPERIMTRTSTTINRRATTKPYILGIPTYPRLLPSLRGPLRPAWAGASLSYLILGISVH